jgi:hypothetical protein
VARAPGGESNRSSSSHSRKYSSSLLGLVSDRIEVAGAPKVGQSLQVFNDVERDRVASPQEGPWAATIFRRRLASPTDADRVAPLWPLREPGLDPDLVLPRVAEVILVEEAFVAAEL